MSPYLPPLAPPAIALAAGVAAGRAATFFPYSTGIFCIAAITTVIFLRPVSLRACLVAALFLAAGFGIYFSYGPGAPSSIDSVTGKGSVAFTGEVVRPPQEREGYTILRLRADTPHPAFVRPGTVRVTMSGTGLDIRYGDVLSGVLELQSPTGYRNPGTFNWGEYAMMNGVDAVAKAKQTTFVRTGNRAGYFMGRVYEFRRDMARKADRSLDARAGAIFRSIILGDQGAVTQELRDVFAASGTTHILSVSGSHIALLTGFLFMLAGIPVKILPTSLALRLSLYVDMRKAAAVVALPSVILYCLIAGSEVATVRSVIMVGVFLVAVLIDRASQLMNMLAAATVAVLLYDPSSLFDISFQLSYLSVLAIALAIIAARDWTPPEGVRLTRRDRTRRAVVITVAVSAAAMAGTAPLVAWQFNSFSFMALPANLTAVPLAGILTVPVGLVSCLLDAISPGGSLPLAWLNSHALSAFYWLVNLFAWVPRPWLHVPAPGILTLVSYYALMLLVMVWDAALSKRIFAGCMVLAVTAALPYVSTGSPGVLRVTFLDVGQGDCSFVEFPDGRTMLIDSGGSGWGMDPGRQTVAPFLWNHGAGRLDYAVLTHPHPDHCGGFRYILSNIRAGQVWEGGLVSESGVYREFRRAAEECGAGRHVIPERGEMDIGGTKLQVLHTARMPVHDAGAEADSAENNRSLVLRIRYKDTSFLFAGDAESEAQDAILGAEPGLPLRSTVLKVPHHGSADAVNTAFLAAVSPSVAVVSSGRANRFGHPSKKMVDALGGVGARVFNTAGDGTVTIESDGDAVRVWTYVGRSLKPARSWRDELENWAKVAGG